MKDLLPTIDQDETAVSYLNRHIADHKRAQPGPITDEQIAAAAGIQKGNLSEMRKPGGRSITAESIRRLAAAIPSINADEFLCIRLLDMLASEGDSRDNKNTLPLVKGILSVFLPSNEDAALLALYHDFAYSKKYGVPQGPIPSLANEDTVAILHRAYEEIHELERQDSPEGEK